MNELIKQDYFKLIRDLNKSNKIKNENTELKFIVLDNVLFAALSKNQKVLLCVKSSKRWLTSKEAYYPDLEAYIANFLNTNKAIADLTNDIKLSIFQVPD